MKIDLLELTQKIKLKALEVGFTACGIAQASHLKEDEMRLHHWLSQGRHAGMHYMQNNFEKRVNPQLLFPGAKSIIVVLLNYFPSTTLDNANGPIISKYAYGEDYHTVVKKRLINLQHCIHLLIPQAESRIFIDTAPIFERTWAARAGLGWIGKNANLIAPKYGSFVFIGEVITNIELLYDKPLKDHCGTCIKCIESCPTKAIISPRNIDSNRCISYWTIENKGAINEKLKGKFCNWIFGCDTCQDVCPWNAKVKVHKIPEFELSPELKAMKYDDWHNLDENKYNVLFKRSAVKRARFEGLKRNVEFLLQ
jgi:epoxyqueuosine reductase